MLKSDSAIQSPDSVTSISSLIHKIQAALTSHVSLLEGLAGDALHTAKARLSYEIISEITGNASGWVRSNQSAELSPRDVQAAMRVVSALNEGAPFAYAVGKAYFRHLVLGVDERVLIPRPETELVVDEVLNLLGNSTGGIAVDIGTGSGAIALSLALEGNFQKVIATDISLDALDVARENYTKCKTDMCPVEFVHGAYFSPLTGIRASVIVSNPPYITYAESAELPQSVRDWEPALALYTGSDGLDSYSTIVNAAPQHLEDGGILALEVDSRRASSVAQLLLEDGNYSDIQIRLDLTGRDRFVIARRR